MLGNTQQRTVTLDAQLADRKTELDAANVKIEGLTSSLEIARTNEYAHLLPNRLGGAMDWRIVPSCRRVAPP